MLSLRSVLSLAFMALLGMSVNGEQPVLTIHGSGTTNPSKCYWHIMDKMEARAKAPLHMTYRAIGSSSGQAEFTPSDPKPLTYFGSGDIPLKSDIYDGLSATETVLQLPVFVGAVSFFHSVPNTPTLNLTACTLAKIMNREITNWDHEEIKSINPELKVPSGGLDIRVARRIDGSSSTSGITGYLAKACDTVWPADKTGSKIDWAPGTLECQGSGGVVDCITEQPGTIGYLDAGHGHGAGLEEIYVQNSFGTKLTTTQSARQGGIAGAADVDGLLPDKASDDFSSVSLLNQPGEFTWPIAAMTYVYVRQDLRFIETPQEQALLKAFLQSLYDDSYVQQCVDAYEFSKVDGRALNISLAAIDSLILNETAEPFVFEQDTELLNATGDWYISAKRKSAAEVEIDVLTTANQQLQSQVTELERVVQQAMLAINTLEGSATTSNGSGGSPTLVETNEAQTGAGSSEEEQNNQIAAALAMSIISIILSGIMLAVVCVRTTVGKHDSGATQNGGMHA
ncbi:binding protein PstS 3 [Seminavis robusta]|uniref:Binding protein PstS 3 n=1 Tax=Seminavis robusta TaxID=568900 RepID=A0A9N8DAW3_9STRA|nr:binding protein PstS 3 [Seminavis robusta]|eukprot:Sro38_g023660.1 binding protein PstS 3 (511) ;mRNA; f:55262-56905